VVPAHAGVFPAFPPSRTSPPGGPRARGGVPKTEAPTLASRRWSPPTRGCSLPSVTGNCEAPVVPAHAGVFLLDDPLTSEINGGPRARGSVPDLRVLAERTYVWSPRTRGCSLCGGGGPHARLVVPAHAGVFPRLFPDRPRTQGPVVLARCPLRPPAPRVCPRQKTSSDHEAASIGTRNEPDESRDRRGPGPVPGSGPRARGVFPHRVVIPRIWLDHSEAACHSRAIRARLTEIETLLRRRLKSLQYRHGVLNAFLAGTRLTRERPLCPLKAQKTGVISERLLRPVRHRGVPAAARYTRGRESAT
jgi:hypothetical protein